MTNGLFVQAGVCRPYELLLNPRADGCMLRFSTEAGLTELRVGEGLLAQRTLTIKEEKENPAPFPIEHAQDCLAKFHF